MVVAVIINLLALAVALGFGALVAAAWGIAAGRRTSLASQARGMGLRPGNGPPELRPFHGPYRSFYVGLEPDLERGELVVRIAHPDQDRIVELPQFHSSAIAGAEVSENVLTLRIPCRRPGRPVVRLKPLVDSAIDRI